MKTFYNLFKNIYYVESIVGAHHKILTLALCLWPVPTVLDYIILEYQVSLQLDSPA